MNKLPFRLVVNRVRRPTQPELPAFEEAVSSGQVDRPSSVDLAGRKKALFFIGRGRTGKSTLVRWMFETATPRASGDMMVAALDGVNRSIRRYIAGVAEPPHSDPGETKEWLRALLEHVMVGKMSVLLDLGGGDTSLTALMREMPDLGAVLADAGIEPVAVHLVGPKVDDLAPLAIARRVGFQPRATAIVCNEVLAPGASDVWQDVLDHPEVTAAIDQGAVQLWMPRLPDFAMRAVEDGGKRFDEVEGGPMTTGTVRAWLRRMGEEFQPIASWLPE